MDYCKPRGRQHSEDVHLSEGLSGFGTDSQWRDVDLAVVEMLREPVGTSITHTHTHTHTHIYIAILCTLIHLLTLVLRSDWK